MESALFLLYFIHLFFHSSDVCTNNTYKFLTIKQTKFLKMLVEKNCKNMVWVANTRTVKSKLLIVILGKARHKKSLLTLWYNTV